jgi:superfamily I DNA and/or RNA helicase
MREEYLDKTVYKITKNRSPQHRASDDGKNKYIDESLIANSDANNLSVQFEKMMPPVTHKKANQKDLKDSINQPQVMMNLLMQPKPIQPVMP